jgi:hypothetical protein
MRRWLPFAFFVGGFFFDVLTLGRMVTTANLMVVCGYALGVAICLLVRSRALPEKWVRWLGFALHFCLGSLFSALVVVYFKSAGELYTLVVVAALFGAMVWNEFANWDDSQLHLLWAIYCVSLVMLFNFVVPHLTGSISAWWFYISSALGVAAIIGLCVLSRLKLRTVRVACASAVVLVLLYTLNLVPPVPLVMKNSLVGTDFQKQDGEYTALVEEPSLCARAGLVDATVGWQPGEHVAVLTAIFAPSGIEVDMEHRWYRHVDGAWSQTDTIGFHMRGGRKNGWRMWSRKRHLQPGRWRVETALEDGAVLGYETFVVVEADPDTEPADTRQAL